MAWPRSTKTSDIDPNDLFSSSCPVREILSTVTSRWASPVLLLLLESSYRFSELECRMSGVSEKMLAQTLRGLEDDGFVLRTVHATKPPKVEYSLTPLGAELAGRLLDLIGFIEESVPRVLAHRRIVEEADRKA